MRILVTGGAGYVGSHCLRVLLAVGHEVVVYDNLSRGHEKAVPAGSLVKGDLTEEAKLTSLLKERNIDAVMHFAALSYVNAAGAAPDGKIGEDHTPESHLIPIVLQVALGQRESISIFGDDYPTPDGTCIRDYVHVDDLAAAHLAALNRLQPGKSI